MGDKEVNRKGDRFLVGFGRTINQDVLSRFVYRLQVLIRGWAWCIWRQGKHLVVVTSELVGVGEISNPF